MQKSLLITLIVTVLGAFSISNFSLELPAYAAFIIGAVVASIVFVALGSSSNHSGAPYKGPTKTLYVGNLPYRVHENEVTELFQEFGPVTSVRLVRDRKTGRRKGFGFVEMAAPSALKAMKKLNDYEFQERTLKVREAKSQEAGPQDS